MSQVEPAKAWIAKAVGDLDVVRRTLMPLPDVNVPAASYHVQQAAEKAVKALVLLHGLRFPRTHDIGVIAAVLPISEPLTGEALALDHVTDWATSTRYPLDDELEPDEAEVRRWAGKVETFVTLVERALDGE